MFSGAHGFVMENPVFIDYSTSADNFMKELLQETIIGAEFDSSDRDPPPRCHPGTRLAIIQRCLDFINQCHDEGKFRWVVGPAGVGKSAVIQMVTETAPDSFIFASIFLSVNGRRDGNRTIITIAYQLAVKSGPYRQFIRDQISLDPSLLRKSLPVQFKKFIVEPFMLEHVFEPSRRFFIVIDGLDECDNTLTQQALLELISDFCITYPTSPIAWIVASRPEPHITSFFDNPEVRSSYTKEEMVIDSDEACEEVQRYLREELKKIRLAHLTLRHKREWPLEHEFTKIASAAGGLFAYAATVVRYIGDSTHRGPAAQLRRVLEIIDASVNDHEAGNNHPMNRLDALYRRILANIPDNVIKNARKLLFLCSESFLNNTGFRGICNALQLTEDDAYDAICHLHAVMKIPDPDEADSRLSYYHKSFGDFLFDFERSGFSRDFKSESLQLCDDTTLRIVEELQDDSDNVADNTDISLFDSVMERRPGRIKRRCDNVSLSWPSDGRFQLTDEEMRIILYRAAMLRVYALFSDHDGFYESISCFHVLTTRFTVPANPFPFDALRDCAFCQFRNELANLGKLKRVPLRAFDYAAVCGDVELRFTRPIGRDIDVSDPWNLSCEHRKEQVDGLEKRHGWAAKFKRYWVKPGAKDDEDTEVPGFLTTTRQQCHEKWCRDDRSLQYPATCINCSRRLARHFMDNPDLLVTVFVDSTQMCYVEVSFVDPDDGLSEWRYRFLHSGRPSSIDA